MSFYDASVPAFLQILGALSGILTKAETHCAESLRIKDAYVPRLTLASAYVGQGKLADAEDVHVQGIKLKPKEGRRYEAYADFLSDVGREEQAQAMYRKARMLDRKIPAKPR